MSDDGRHTGDLGGNVLREEYTPFVVQERIGPLIPVKWGQGHRIMFVVLWSMDNLLLLVAEPLLPHK